MRNIVPIILGALAAASCASSQTNGYSASTESEAQPLRGGAIGGKGMMMGGAMGEMCPMAVEGTAARAEDVEGGAALVFTTTGDLADLRRRVGGMAEMHNEHHAEGMMGGPAGSPGADVPPGPGAGMGMGHMGGKMGGGMMMPAATARTEDVEDGVRLVFTPRDPADLGTLREKVAHHAQNMAAGECPMMSAGQDEATAKPTGPSEHEGHHPPGT